MNPKGPAAIPHQNSSPAGLASARPSDPSNGFQAVLDELRPGRRFFITSHARPDGDAVGSVLALSAILQQLGCTTLPVLADPVPAIYSELAGADTIVSTVDPAFAPDAVILLECDGVLRSGLKGLDSYRLINIDHHASGKLFGHVNWIDPHTYAVAAMVYLIAETLSVQITPEIATCLYTAILTDTGSFTYAATTSATFELAGLLVRSGANPSEIARQTYFNNPASKLRLLGTALSRMTILRHGRVAVTSVTCNEMSRLEAGIEDCEGIANYLIGIAGVGVAVFLCETADQTGFRVSLRSDGQVDVAALAEHFGGGGHRNASGCTIPVDPAISQPAIDLAVEQITRSILHELPEKL